jgi:general secretion pathway protein I
MNRRSQQGFTLIEVLAALIIVALGMMAVIQAVTQTINNANYLREKTIAHWVAMNKVTEVRLSATVPSGGDSSGDVEMAGTTWHWRMTIDATAVIGMQRIDVNVAPKSAGDKASIATASGFYGKAIATGGNHAEWDPVPSLAPGSTGTVSGVGG